MRVIAGSRSHEVEPVFDCCGGGVFVVSGEIWLLHAEVNLNSPFIDMGNSGHDIQIEVEKWAGHGASLHLASTYYSMEFQSFKS